MFAKVFMEQNRLLHNFVCVLRPKHFLPAFSLALCLLKPVGVALATAAGSGLVDTDYFHTFSLLRL